MALQATTADAEAVVLNNTGLPTMRLLDTRERDLKTPVLSRNRAPLWQALRPDGVQQASTGFGSLLRAIAWTGM